MQKVIDHTILVAQLSDADRNTLTQKSDWPGIIHLCVYTSIMVVCAIWIYSGIFAWQFIMLPYSIMMVFLFTLLHEVTHETAFRTKAINIWVGRICGLLLISPPIWFRYFHLAHHRYTNDPDKDPELASPRPRTFGEYLIYISGILIWVSQIRFLLKDASGKVDDAFIPQKGKAKVVREARIYLLIYSVVIALAIITRQSDILWLWVYPLLIGQPFLRMFLLAEHFHTPLISNMLLNSRTTYTSRILSFLSWNMSYHAEHHTYPGVPFHQLPKFHEMTRDHVGLKQEGYAAFHKDEIKRLKREQAK